MLGSQPLLGGQLGGYEGGGVRGQRSIAIHPCCARAASAMTNETHKWRRRHGRRVQKSPHTSHGACRRARALMSPLAEIRRIYRALLPRPVRERMIWLSRRVLTAVLSTRIPPLRAALAQPSQAAAVAGFLSTPHGVGVAARLCIAELKAAGMPVRGIDLTAALRAPSEPMAPLTDSPSENEALILHFNPGALVHALIELDKAELKRRRIGYWVWELERAPESWRNAAKYVHEIWAPSRFAADAIRAVVPNKVTVAPHPAALSPPPVDPAQRAPTRARFGLGDEGFLALTSFSMSSGFARKNPLAAIRAFKDAFDVRKDTRLIVRCRDAEIYPAGLEMLRAAVREAGDNVVLLDQPTAGDALPALYAACDTYISLHRSEGFGLNLAEAMLSERPVIATAWSGNLDFMEEDSVALVPCQLIDVTDPQRIYRQRNARWAEPDHDAAVAHLRKLAADSSYRLTLGRAGAALAQARLSGGAAAAALRQNL